MADGNQTLPAEIDENPSAGVVPAGGTFLAAPQSFDDLKEMAKYMAKGELMVGHAVRGNPGDCMAVIMQAGRFGMDPFALSQKTYVVEDRGGNRKIAYEAQAVSAMVAASGAIEGRLRYQYGGEGQGRYVRVFGRIKGDSEDCEITTPPVSQIAVKNSPLWKGDPDQQLAYYGSRAWCRRHTSDVLMGVYTPDEFEAQPQFINVTPGAQTNDPAKRLEARLDEANAQAEPAATTELSQTAAVTQQGAQDTQGEDDLFTDAEVVEPTPSAKSEAADREAIDLPTIPKIDLTEATDKEVEFWAGALKANLVSSPAAGVLWLDHSGNLKALEKRWPSLYDKLAVVIDARGSK